jgi:hypothetical protein
MFEFLTFGIYLFFQTTLNGEMIKIKAIDLETFHNIIVDNRGAPQKRKLFLECTFLYLFI